MNRTHVHCVHGTVGVGTRELELMLHLHEGESIQRIEPMQDGVVFHTLRTEKVMVDGHSGLTIPGPPPDPSPALP